VVADEVLVLHHGGASFSQDARLDPVQEEHERMLAARYPYYHDAVHELEADFAGPLARALGAARRALCGMSVLIDAGILAGPMTGTQLQVLEVVGALARTGELRLGVITPDELSEDAARTLRGMPDVRLIDRRSAARGEVERADVVHRPYQLRSEEELALLASLGERLVVTNQDLISFHNPSYFESSLRWQRYRRVTQAALAAADQVVFISDHAREEALVEDLLDPNRATVVHNGVDHSLMATGDPPVPPRALAGLPAGAEAILCLGTDFRHKNRLFALRLAAELRDHHGWDGHLLFAGPHVSRGSSAAEEAEFLAMNPALAQVVTDLAAVGEAEKAWLFRRSRLVLYPTVHEGFGLVPFEAADHGTPCLWAPGTSLAEVLPPTAGGIVPWNVELTGERAIALLRDEQERARHLEVVQAAARALTWDAAAEKLLEVYRQTCAAPASPGGGVARRFGVMAPHLSADAVRLVGPDGVLPTEVERPLLALASHPVLGAPMFGAMKLGYRAGFVWSRRLRPRRSTG
jgi:glycosyltransferase involved in cell wall biosynthesis